MNVRKEVLIVDDHPLFREGLKAIIGRAQTFNVVGEAGRYCEALRLALELKPHIILVDISLPDGSGIQLARQIRKMLPQAIIVMVSVHSAANYVAESFQAGAVGYLTKESVPEMLLQALESVSEAKYYFEGAVSEDSIRNLMSLASHATRVSEPMPDSLTHREHEILRLLAEGRSCSQIAQDLCISQKTVYNHRTHIMEKLGLRTPFDLFRRAVELGLVNENPTR